MAYPVAEQFIEEAERQLGRRLPPVLRDRLRRDNGGAIEVVGDECWQLFPVWDPTNKKTMRKTTGHIIHETKSARDWYGFPQDAIAIATDGSGNYVIVQDGKDGFDYWDHETGEIKSVVIAWK